MRNSTTRQRVVLLQTTYWRVVLVSGGLSSRRGKTVGLSKATRPFRAAAWWAAGFTAGSGRTARGTVRSASRVIRGRAIVAEGSARLDNSGGLRQRVVASIRSTVIGVAGAVSLARRLGRKRW